MNIAVEILGRKALPVWTIPYVTGRYVSPDRLLEMLAKSDCDEGRYSGFPHAFKLDESGNPYTLPPSQWSEAVGQIVKLEDDLDEKSLNKLEDRQQWCKQSIELIMPYKAYLWLDEFEAFFEKYRQRFVLENPEICLYPLMLIEHEEHFKTTEKTIKKPEALTDYHQANVSRATKSEWNIYDLIDKPLTDLINGAKAFEEDLLQTNSFDYSWQLNTWRTDLETALRQNEIIPEKTSQATDRIKEFKKWANERPPYENGVPEFIYGEPELPYTDSISFYQANALFDRDATEEEFALYVFDSQIRVYEGHFSDSKLRAILNIQDWLLAHGKVECFSGKDYPVDSALDRFRFSKREIEDFRPEYRYVHFDKAKKVIENHLGEPDKAERFLIRNLEFNKIGAYHPLFGRVLPENSLAGERWRKCFVPEWQLRQLTEDLPAAIHTDKLTPNFEEVHVRKCTFPQSGKLPESEDDESRLTKLEKQQKAILQVIKAKQYEPKKIPDGGKGILKQICESDFPGLFDGDTSFDNAWKQSRNLFMMANHESYSRRGNN